MAKLITHWQVYFLFDYILRGAHSALWSMRSFMFAPSPSAHAQFSLLSLRAIGHPLLAAIGWPVTSRSLSNWYPLPSPATHTGRKLCIEDSRFANNLQLNGNRNFSSKIPTPLHTTAIMILAVLVIENTSLKIFLQCDPHLYEVAD